LEILQDLSIIQEVEEEAEEEAEEIIQRNLNKKYLGLYLINQKNKHKFSKIKKKTSKQ